MPSMNVIFLNGDKVQGTGNPVIERLSDPRNISELLVSKLGCSVNVWVLEASTYNESFAVYKEFIPSLTSRGEPKRYDPSGFPASSAIVAILTKCFEQVRFFKDFHSRMLLQVFCDVLFGLTYCSQIFGCSFT